MRAINANAPTGTPMTTGRKKGESLILLDLGVLVTGAETVTDVTITLVGGGAVVEPAELVGIVVLYSIDVKEKGTPSLGSVAVRRSVCCCGDRLPPGIKNIGELPGLVPLRVSCAST